MSFLIKMRCDCNVIKGCCSWVGDRKGWDGQEGSQLCGLSSCGRGRVEALGSGGLPQGEPAGPHPLKQRLGEGLGKDTGPQKSISGCTGGKKVNVDLAVRCRMSRMWEEGAWQVGECGSQTLVRHIDSGSEMLGSHEAL